MGKEREGVAEAPNIHDERQDNEEPQAEGPIMVDGLELGAADDSDLDEEEMTAEEETSATTRDRPDEEPGEDRGYNDATADGATKRQRIALMIRRLQSLQTVMPVSVARKLIEKIERARLDLCGKQLNHRQRRTEMQLNDERSRGGVLSSSCGCSCREERSIG